MLGNLNVNVEPDTFEPGLCSIPELHFILKNLGQPPIAAFEGFDPRGNAKHVGVIRVRAEAVLGRLYELEQLKQFRSIEWAGIDAIEDSITRYLEWHDRTKAMKALGFKRGEPSQFHWDETGEPYKYAIGADSGELVRTGIQDDGSRKPFGVKLTHTPSQVMRQDLSKVAPWINRGAVAATIDTLDEAVKGRMGTIRCSICGKVEEFDAGDRTKRMAARGRMAKHLKNAKQELNRHRLLARKEFK